MSNHLMRTPTNSSQPTPECHYQNQENQNNSSEVSNTDPSSNGTFPAMSVIHGSGDEQFELNLGIITISNLKLTNELHRDVLGILVFILSASVVYREYCMIKKQLINQKAYQFACDSFLNKLDQIKIKNKNLTLPNRVNFWDWFIHPRKVQEYNTIISDLKAVQKGIESFQDEYRGKINIDLEKAIIHLSELIANKPINLDSIIVALEEIYIVAVRLGLSPVSIHPIKSVIFQLRRATSTK